MADKWTDEQKKAIETDGGGIIVSAAAGSGKTAVLVERVIEKILKGKSVDRFLIVTFTVAAAGEMRERIAAAISEKLSENPSNRHLQRQNVLIHKAKICTIDSFCVDLVRSNFHLLNISPDFRIADTVENSLLKQAVCSEVLEEFYSAEDDGGFSQMADNFGTDKSDIALENILYKITDSLDSTPFSDKWLDKTLSYYNPDNFTTIKESVWGSEVYLAVAEVFTQYINAYNKLLIELTDYAPIYEAYSPMLTKDNEMLNEALKTLNAGGWDKTCDIVLNYDFGAKPSVRGYTDHPVKIRAGEIRDSLKKDILKLKDGLMSVKEKDLKEDLIILYPVIKTLFDVVRRYTERLQEEKRRLNILSFSDIAQQSLTLLVKGYDEETGVVTPSETAKSVKKLYDEILIDEYQDTNGVQDLTFTAISDSRKNIFTVGDVKQSIYRFRYANPQIFLKRKEEAENNIEGEISALVTLSDNFRSRGSILSLINFIFGQTMSAYGLGELDYTEKEMLYPAAQFPDSSHISAEVDIIEYKAEDSDVSEENSEDLNRDEREAIYVANRIKGLIQSGFKVYDKDLKAMRNVKAGDFTVLLRNLKGRGVLYQKAIEDVGIPAFCEQSSSFFEAYEIEMIVSILQAIDNPYNDIPLIAAMRSPVFAFTPDELAQIRLCSRKGYFYKAVKKAAQNGDKRCAEFIDKLEEYRAMSRDLPVYRLIMYIYSDTSLYSLAGSMERGFVRQENLNVLCRHAKNYEASGAKGLYGFINYINRIIEDQGDLTGAKPSPAGDSVLVTTIHKSKGLEFPVCILAGCSIQFNFEDMRSPLLIHNRLGLGPFVRDTKLLAEYTTLPREAVMSILKREMLSEELRILYVALTRAKEKLIIVSSVKNLDDKISNLALKMGNGEKIEPFLLMSSRSFSEWLLACLLRHPSCAALRERVKGGIEPFDTNSEIKLNITKYNEQDTIEETKKEEKAITNDEGLLKEITERLDYCYPHIALSKIPVKVSVSELKGRRIDETDTERLYLQHADFAKPAFMLEALSASSIGTAMHRFMQYADYSKCSDEKGIQEELDTLYSSGLFTNEEAKSIDISKLSAFFESDLFKRLNASQTNVKEYRFTMGIPAAEYEKNLPETDREETILVQGVIDCFFEEEDGFVLIDYKTDNVNDEHILTERYALQLDYYARAIEAIFKKRVKQKYLYSFSLGKEIEIR